MDRNEDSAQNVILTVVFVGAVIALGIPIFDAVASAGGGDPVTRHTDVGVATGEFRQIDTSGDVKEVLQVNDSTGYGVALTGANDSYVESAGSIDVPTDQNFTIGTWAQVDEKGDAENMTMTAISVQGEAVISYNGSTGNWTGYYYSDKTRDSYRVDVDAPNQPGNLTWVALWANGTHVTIYANTTQGEIVALNSNTADASIDAANWNGTVDETRGFGEPLTSSERSDIVNNPVAPQPGQSRLFRLMYDQGGGDSTPIYFASDTASLSNASWVSALSGNILTQGSDYAVGWFSDAIKALDGGGLDGAPVAWVTYRIVPQELLGGVLASLGDALVLGSLVAVVVVAKRLVGSDLRGSGHRRR